MEEWKRVCGYEDYEVSNLGRVRSWRQGIRSKPKSKPVIIAGSDRLGYRAVDLYDRMSGHKQFGIHRLVCEAFLLNPGDKPYVNHKNFDRSDNRAENLEWCTAHENTLHAKAGGRCNGGHGASELNGGKRHPKAKLSLGDARRIKELLANGEKQRVIAEMFGVGRTAIADIKRGRTWSHA